MADRDSDKQLALVDNGIEWARDFKKVPYSDDWKLETIPDAILQSEVGRRRGAQRKVRTGGRPAIPTPCPKCGMTCAGVVAAKAHCKGVKT